MRPTQGEAPQGGRSTDDTRRPAPRRGHLSTRSGAAVVELLRLVIVLAVTGIGYSLGEPIDEAFGLGVVDETRLLSSVLGALFGYLLGGVAGRAAVRGVDTAAARLEQVPSVTLVAAGLGAGTGAFVGIMLFLPVLLLPLQRFTVPLTVVVVMILAYLGGRLGAARGPDLGRFVGVRGRLEVRAPARGGGVKLLDSSVLIDGRVVEVARAGFLEGTLVVPRFVVEEVQALADSASPHRRQAGQRGLEALQALGDEGLVALEVSDEDVEEADEVDAKLAMLARRRQAALVTADSGLAAIAEVAGVRVLNPHLLAEAVRPPVLPGDRVTLRIVKEGREAGQGVGYLEDGTMVVVEEGAAAVGQRLAVDVTSIMQNRQGRMLFGAPAYDTDDG